jgi:hypothetical protein
MYLRVVSSHVVVIIPERCGEIPDEEAERRARAVLAEVPTLRDVDARRDDGLRFVDCGENFESVRCPSCGADAMAWWGDAMDRAWTGDAFGDLAITTPCCAARTTLHDLRYDFTQGFARFQLRATNHDGALAPDVVARIERALGCPVRVVYAHY